jgi:excisionase family DNA binding protein
MADRTDAAAETAAAQDSPAAAPVESAAAPDIGGLSGVLSAREAAVALGVSERTVRRAIQRGEIIATKHAGSFQITPAAIEDFRRRETGQGVLSHAASPDRPAAARDIPVDRAAATDTSQVAGDAVAVLRELLAEERRKSDSLLEASLVWQGRALQLEERLKALEAGPIAGDVEEAAVTHESGPLRGDQAAEGADTRQRAWRRWWRKMTGGAVELS